MGHGLLGADLQELGLAEPHHDVRVATGGRFEYRGVDSSCNPYLTTVALLQAGLDGVRRKLDPGPPQQGNTYELLQQGVEIERVPRASALR